MKALQVSSNLYFPEFCDSLQGCLWEQHILNAVQRQVNQKE